MSDGVNERNLKAFLSAQPDDGAAPIRLVRAARIGGALIPMVLDARGDRADDDRCADSAPDRMLLARRATGRAKSQEQNCDGFHKSLNLLVWKARAGRSFGLARDAPARCRWLAIARCAVLPGAPSPCGYGS